MNRKDGGMENQPPFSDKKGMDARLNRLIEEQWRHYREAEEQQRLAEGKKIPLEHFLSLSGNALVDEAFERILGRAPDDSTREHYVSALTSGALEPIDFLLELYQSPEGRSRDLSIEGLRRRHRLMRRLRRLPFAGRWIRLAGVLWRLPGKLALLEARQDLCERKIKDERTLREGLQLSYRGLQSSFDALEDVFWQRHGSVEIEPSRRSAIPDFTTPPSQEERSSSSHPPEWAEYSRFEEAFYDHAKVLEKQKIYLEEIPKKLLSEETPHLDLGCGRGEFLTLLRREGLWAEGVDLNPLEVEKLRTAGYRVHCADLLEFLEKEERRFASISAFQVIEHLSSEKIKRLVELANRRLLPGGVLILETINPHNPFTLASFYMDETHVRLVPPEWLAFAMQRCGMRELRRIDTAPMPAPFRFNEPARDYHDYALVGVAP